MVNRQNFSINEAAKMLGVKGTSIRYYLNNGLVPHVRRARNGYRVLEMWQIDLLQILLNMKQAGFGTKQIRHYASLFREGKQTEAARLAMLTTRKHQLWQEIEQRQKAIAFIERQEEIARAVKARH